MAVDVERQDIVVVEGDGPGTVEIEKSSVIVDLPPGDSISIDQSPVVVDIISEDTLVLTTATEIETIEVGIQGPQGPVGPPGTGASVQEVPSGAVDGTNTIFTLSQMPNNSAGVVVELNGLALVQGLHYTLSGQTVTLSQAPEPSDVVSVYYQVG